MMIAGTEHRRQGCSLQDGKQWGKTISGNNVKTKFPIAFTAFCMLSVSVNSSNGNAAESVFRNGFGYTNKTLSDWILRGPTSDATYFADYIAIFPIPFPNSALAITSAGIGGWHTVDVSIVNNNSYSVLGWATDSPSTARTSLPNVIAIGF